LHDYKWNQQFIYDNKASIDILLTYPGADIYNVSNEGLGLVSLVLSNLKHIILNLADKLPAQAVYQAGKKYRIVKYFNFKVEEQRYYVWKNIDR
jgi:hypothetical protein